MVCYLKKICGINQAEDRVTWPDLLHRHANALASFREWSVLSAWLRFVPSSEIPASHVVQLRLRPVYSILYAGIFAVASRYANLITFGRTIVGSLCQSASPRPTTGRGPGTFCWFFFNVMLTIWDSRHEDLLTSFLTEFQTLGSTGLGLWAVSEIIFRARHYRQVSNIRRTKSQHLKRLSYCLAAVFAEYLEARCWVENEDVVGAAPTGDAPTTSEWSTILLPTKVRLILEILR